MNPKVSNLCNFRHLTLLLAFSLSLSSARGVTVDVTLDQLALTYTSSSFATEITSGFIQIGRLNIAESNVEFADRSSFDSFLGSVNWTRYGSELPYILNNSSSAKYTFTDHFEPFVKNFGSTSLTEDPYQVYVAIRDGSDLFGLFTFRGDDGSVHKFAATQDDTPVFTLANEGSAGGIKNLEAVNSYGLLYVSSSAPKIALIPEPSSGSLLLGSLGFYLAFASARKLQQKS
jgi:hypothetical protein